MKIIRIGICLSELELDRNRKCSAEFLTVLVAD